MLSDDDQVRNLLGTYCERLDAGDFEGVGALFAAGRLATEDGAVLASGAEAVAAFYRAGTLDHDGSPRTKHLVVDTVLVPADDDRSLTARSSYVVYQAVTGSLPLQPIITGRYVDTFERADDGWRWSERRFSVDQVGDLSQHLVQAAVTVALVTGAASGIGAAVARRLAADGTQVVGVDLVAGDGVLRCDVTSTEEVAAVAASLERLDVLANVAGIPQFGRVEHITDAEWDQVLAVDLTGAFKVVRAALPLLKASRGCIVNLASVAGIQGQAYTAAYSAAKGGLVAFTRALAVELAPDGVRANCVCPGGVDTPLLARARFPDDADPRLLALLIGPLAGATLASAEHVADAVAWLASPAAVTVTGIALPMDAGRSA